MTLTELPVEIIAEIVGYIADSDRDDLWDGERLPSKHWLNNLALTCRQLHAVVTPTLYSTIKSVCDILPLRTVATCPQLARYVRVFEVYSDEYNYGPAAALEKLVTESEWAAFRELATKASGTAALAQSWIAKLESADMDAFSALLLVALPNLERISIPPLGLHDGQILRQVVEQAVLLQRGQQKSPFSFSHLREVKLDIHCGEEIDVNGALPFLRLQSVGKFFGHGFRHDSERDVDEERAFKPATVPPVLGTKDIELHYANLLEEEILRFFQNFDRLERMTYFKASMVKGFAEGDKCWSPALNTTALAHLKPCLQHLTYESGHDWETHLYPLGDLSKIVKLVSLEVMSFMMVFDEELCSSPQRRLVDVIPRCLERIRLRSCGGGVLRNVAELLEHLEFRSPKLKSIELNFADWSDAPWETYSPDDYRKVEDNLDCLLAQGQLLGVDLQIDRDQ